ncbi:hypothetical protein EF808_03165 [archaeon]|nr:MAG: hypothetical protein EF808_03165 [archaeon]
MSEVLRSIVADTKGTRKRPLAKNCFVGVGCQANAVRKIEHYTYVLRGLPKVEERVYFPYPFWPTGKQFIIGLFCTENFSHNSVKTFIERKWGLSMNEVEKVNISGGRIYVHTADDVVSASVVELTPYARGNCKLCPDLMADFADISVGGVGSRGGYSTVVLRTPEGKEFFKKALAAKVIEAEELHDKKELDDLIEFDKKMSRRSKKSREKKGYAITFLDKWDDEDDPNEFARSVNEHNIFTELEEDVILTGQCVDCGACGLVCPDHNIRFENDRPYGINRCPDVPCGYCYMVCPRTQSFHKQWANTDDVEFYSVRAARVSGGVQDGGVVSALLTFGLEREMFETVTINTSDDALKPKVMTTNDVRQVREAAGSKYSVSPSVLGLRGAR